MKQKVLGAEQKRFLSYVRVAHGDAVARACRRIILSAGKGDRFAPLDILAQAQDEVYGEELRAAEAVADYGFDDSV